MSSFHFCPQLYNNTSSYWLTHFSDNFQDASIVLAFCTAVSVQPIHYMFVIDADCPSCTCSGQEQGVCFCTATTKQLLQYSTTSPPLPYICLPCLRPVPEWSTIGPCPWSFNVLKKEARHHYRDLIVRLAPGGFFLPCDSCFPFKIWSM